MAFRAISSRVWRRLKIDRRLVFRYLHYSAPISGSPQNRRRVIVGALSRLQCADFGVSREAFWRPFRGLSRLEMDDFGVSRDAFWRPFQGLSRSGIDYFGVSRDAFWRPFRGLSRLEIDDLIRFGGLALVSTRVCAFPEPLSWCLGHAP